MTSPAESAPQTDRRRTAKERLQRLYREYGPVAIGVFAVLWGVTLGAIYTAVSMGWRPESAAGQTGTFAAAYVIFRLTLPFRIAATVLVAPLAAKLLEKLGLRRPVA